MADTAGIGGSAGAANTFSEVMFVGGKRTGTPAGHLTGCVKTERPELVHAMASRGELKVSARSRAGQQSPWSILALTPCQLSARRDLHTCSCLYSSAATCIAVRRFAFRSLARETDWRAPEAPGLRVER